MLHETDGDGNLLANIWRIIHLRGSECQWKRLNGTSELNASRVLVFLCFSPYIWNNPPTLRPPLWIGVLFDRCSASSGFAGSKRWTLNPKRDHSIDGLLKTGLKNKQDECDSGWQCRQRVEMSKEG